MCKHRKKTQILHYVNSLHLSLEGVTLCLGHLIEKLSSLSAQPALARDGGRDKQRQGQGETERGGVSETVFTHFTNCSFAETFSARFPHTRNTTHTLISLSLYPSICPSTYPLSVSFHSQSLSHYPTFSQSLYPPLSTSIPLFSCNICLLSSIL